MRHPASAMLWQGIWLQTAVSRQITAHFRICGRPTLGMTWRLGGLTGCSLTPPVAIAAATTSSSETTLVKDMQAFPRTSLQYRGTPIQRAFIIGTVPQAEVVSHSKP